MTERKRGPIARTNYSCRCHQLPQIFKTSKQVCQHESYYRKRGKCIQKRQPNRYGPNYDRKLNAK